MQKSHAAEEQGVRSPCSNDNAGRSRSNLDAAQRARKRQVDRICQRASRDRTKARIAHLESLVESFQKNDNSGQIGSLMEQLNDVRQEKEKLSKMLQSIIKITQSLQESEGAANILGTTDLGSVDTVVGDLRQPSNNDFVAPSFDNSHEHELPRNELLESESHSHSHNQEAPTSLPLNLSLDGEINDSPSVPFVNTVQPTTEPNSFSCGIEGSAVRNPSTWTSPVEVQNTTCDCSRISSSGSSSENLWQFANQALVTAASSSKTHLQERLCEDIPIRVVLSGWDQVEQDAGLDASWQMLRQIDQQLFSTCGSVERLAILRTMHLLLRSHIDPSTERKLPAWYRPRPSQSLVPHSYAIDFFTWWVQELRSTILMSRPGLRERFVYYEHRYCKNLFWELFRTSFHIAWPYEFRDCYTRNTETGMYEISLLFDQRLRDIQCWTMGPDMFTAFPEFLGDIPMMNQIHRSVSSNKFNEMVPFQRQTSRQKKHVSHLEEDAADTESTSATNRSTLDNCDDIFTVDQSFGFDFIMHTPEEVL